jgi:hypothetical protein
VTSSTDSRLLKSVNSSRNYERIQTKVFGSLKYWSIKNQIELSCRFSKWSTFKRHQIWLTYCYFEVLITLKTTHEMQLENIKKKKEPLKLHQFISNFHQINNSRKEISKYNRRWMDIFMISSFFLESTCLSQPAMYGKIPVNADVTLTDQLSIQRHAAGFTSTLKLSFDRKSCKWSCANSFV